MVHMYHWRDLRENCAGLRPGGHPRHSRQEVPREPGPAPEASPRPAKSIRLWEAALPARAAAASASPQRLQADSGRGPASPRPARQAGQAPSTLKSLQLALAELLLKKERGSLGVAQARSRKKIVLKQRLQLSHRSLEPARSPSPPRPPRGPPLALALAAAKAPGRRAPSPGPVSKAPSQQDPEAPVNTRCCSGIACCGLGLEAPPQRPAPPSQRGSPDLEAKKRRMFAGDPTGNISLVLSRHRRTLRAAQTSRQPSPEACRPEEACRSFFGRVTARQLATGTNPPPAPGSPHEPQEPRSRPSNALPRSRKPAALGGPENATHA